MSLKPDVSIASVMSQRNIEGTQDPWKRKYLGKKVIFLILKIKCNRISIYIKSGLSNDTRINNMSDKEVLNFR